MQNVEKQPEGTNLLNIFKFIVVGIVFAFLNITFELFSFFFNLFTFIHLRTKTL